MGMHYAGQMKRSLPHIALLLLTLLVLPAVLGETLYKWVDAQGNVHYSDKPQPGATKVHMPNAQTYVAPAVAVPAGHEGGGGQAQQPQAAYSGFQITSPEPDETFNNVQSVTVTVSVDPSLQQGDNITISMDGQSQGPGTALSATFDDVERGEHSATATLIEANGQVLSAPAVTFYIQKAVQKVH
jgi:hypothetical protein